MTRRAAPVPAQSAWTALRHPIFRALWIADVVSNIGTWMHDAAAAWLMTILDPSPVMVSLVQVSTTFPLFLLALPAGAMADVFDRRTILLIAQVWMFAATALLGILTLSGSITPLSLILLTLAIGAGSAIDLPSWQSLIPETVPVEELPSAIGLGTIAINIARAVGPALAGLIIVAGGPGPVFVINAVSVLVVIFVLWRWKRERKRVGLPAERLASAVRAGVRYVRHAPALRTVIVRTPAFVFFASALWALLPLLVKVKLGRGPISYGLLVGSLGLGGLLGAGLLPRFRTRWSTDTITAAASAAFATGCLILAWVHYFPLLVVVAIMTGVGWLTTVSCLLLAAQRGAAEWVRGRALSISTLTLFGSLAIGAFVWGVVAKQTSIRFSLTIAGTGVFFGLALIPRFKLSAVENLNLEPAKLWLDPVVVGEIARDAGPVLITVEYLLEAESRAEFARQVRRLLAPIRRRDGAIFWELFADSSNPRRCIECWLVESWEEHLRQHERATKSDGEVENALRQCYQGKELVTHYIALN